MPSAFISAQALALVASPVAKPGMVKPRMFVRGRPSRSQRLGGDDQGVGGIEPARDADHDVLGAGRLQAADEALRPGC